MKDFSREVMEQARRFRENNFVAPNVILVGPEALYDFRALGNGVVMSHAGSDRREFAGMTLIDADVPYLVVAKTAI